MSRPQVLKYRERIASVEYEIAKERIKKQSMEEFLEQRIVDKKRTLENKFKWETVYQLGLEQTELQIHIHEAHLNKLINELSFLRLELEELLAETKSKPYV